MAFLDGKTAKEIKNALKNIKRNCEQQPSLDAKKPKVREIINGILLDIPGTKEEVIKNANEHKAKPWIDQKFDTKIDSFANSEIQFISKLQANLTENFELLQLVENDKDLAAITDQMDSDASAIEQREKKSNEELEKMERETLAERFSKPSDAPPARKTKDGVSWSNIAKVSRQLGGWLECGGGGHICSAVFQMQGRKFLFLQML